jgi:hypothetical protein
MKTQITYIASSGNRYNLTANGVLHRTANYYSWTWDVVGTNLQYGVRVSDFSRKPAEYDAEIIVYGTPAERRRFLTMFHYDIENDIRKKKPGRLVWGDYYIDCYIRQSQTNPTETWRYLSNTIHIYAPYPFWVQEKQITLPTSNEQSSEFLDFPINFPFDFTAPTIGEMTIKSDFPFDSEFRMIIYGLAVNPRITINGYSYVLYTTIPDGAYVIVDSRTHTITQYNTDGTQSNMFNYRNKTDSIFAKIPGGNLRIAWDATFGADITIFQEKSEPEFEEVVE